MWDRFRHEEDLAQVADRIRKALPNVKAGTLRFGGVWFGRPYDNLHTLMGRKQTDSALILDFDGSEVLHVFSPSEVTADVAVFKISDASRVRWEWFYYGRPKVESNRCVLEFIRITGGVQIRSSEEQAFPIDRPDASVPAVEIL